MPAPYPQGHHAQGEVPGQSGDVGKHLLRQRRAIQGQNYRFQVRSSNALILTQREQQQRLLSVTDHTVGDAAQ
jgi:hypothetical protein